MINSSSIIPEELILETIDTLSLLLPRHDLAIRKWFQKLQKSHKLDPGVITSRYLDFSEREINNYHFWRERLVKLKNAFDEHEPKGYVYVESSLVMTNKPQRIPHPSMKPQNKKANEQSRPLQWWRDDRRSVQWWTFWIAALVLFLTIFFGLIQSVAAVLQILRP